jgi:regulation of enolase protein 1 (concanavalin A-like superfamily)
MKVQAGAITREVWLNIPGTAVGNLTGDSRYPNEPSETHLAADFFEAPVNFADNYGQRMHGYIVPPVTGNYTFWIASDDGGELWLSTDQNPLNQKLIANVAGWTNAREWTREANQRSAPIALEASRVYYVAALQKEGSGGDNLAVRWLRPDGLDEGPIPATHLLPWGTVFAPPVILEQPTNTTVLEGQFARFSVMSDPLSPATVQWQRNGLNIPSANSFLLEYGPATMGDQNARFRAVLTNSLGGAVSEEASLSVTPDLVRPTLVAALNLSTTVVRVTFSEPVEISSGTLAANYGFSGGVEVLSAAFGEDSSTILLTTTPLTYGATYTITVNDVRDRAAASNVILPGSTINYLAVEYTPTDIGLSGGGTAIVPGGFDVTGLGRDIGGASDQFHFGYKERMGDFDLRVRIAGVTITDPYVQAGLMAREDLEANSRFAGVFASSTQLGCFVESRTTAGGQTQIAAPPGKFPANYPETWLRLRRSGNQFTGFGSFDGQAWQELGGVTMSLPSKLFFGMAVSSHDTNNAATAQFRDLSVVVNPTTFTFTPEREALGPSNRRTGLIFSEIMYHPQEQADGRDLEFIELYNAGSIFVDLTGWRLTGAVRYRFPDGYRLQAGEFAVVAADPEGLETVYGLGGVLGPFDGRLNNAGETLRLRNAAGAVRLEVAYSPNDPWPVAANGAGHSLVLARPSYGEDDPRAWSASERIGGSPGGSCLFGSNRWSGVVINEFLAHTDDPVVDFVELYNASNVPVDISGCFLSDRPLGRKFRIPDGTVLPPRGFIVFDQNQLGFALSSQGETVYFVSADESRVLDVVRFAGQENGVSTGRAPDGAPTVRRLAEPTPGAVNAPWRIEQVVINEIMYHPISADDDDQYVELHNRSSEAVDLSGWRFVEGITYQFPSGAVVPAGGYVVVGKNAERLRVNYPQLNANNTFGNFSGNLSKRGERLALAMPDQVVAINSEGQPVTNTIQIVVSEVTYHDGGRWPERADGGGSSLELIDSRADLLRPSNWAASDESQKAPWTAVEFTGRADLGNGSVTANRFQILMLGAGECLIDDVEIFRAGSTNLLANGAFENGATGWTFFGNHSGSEVVSTGAYSGQNCLHVRAPGDGDTANNAIRANMTSIIPTGQSVTIRAKVRWLGGWPEVLFRVRGNWIELPARMEIPKNLGTPGLPNSRRVPNAGPAIFDVTHTPALPQANQAVLVTCRVSDPDGVAAPQLRFRVDPMNTLTTVTMRDDGTGGDAVAGDGIYTARISGRSSGSLVAFRIEARDDASPSVLQTFPDDAPKRECLIRWGGAQPFGTFAHYHIWSTSATENARRNSPALNNTFRDGTLVYGNFRVIYNAGFRDKGSPYHGGSGDFAVTVPRDEMLLGVDDRVFGSTGNGGSEATGMRGDVACWVGEQLGIPFLHSHYMRLFRNGSQFRDILYDLEQPNRYYARSWFGQSEENDDLFKIAVWFEFQDNNSSFSATGATLGRFLSEGEYKLARYRWNWQLRPPGNTANDFTTIYNLVTAANNTSDRVTGLMNIADMEQWMRVFAYNRVLGNWDAWTFNVGQNMFMYSPMGQRTVLMPWDIDFVLGLGNGTSDALWGGQDPVVNQLYNVPTYRRMLWRAYQDAVKGPMLPEQYEAQVDARRAVLLKNNVTGLSDPRPIKLYLEGRRKFIETQIRNADAAGFEITTQGGSDFSTSTPVVSLAGNAPFAIATIEVNGVPYPVVWTSHTAWRIELPLGAATNLFEIAGRDRLGQLVPGASANVTIQYTGSIPQPQDWVVINEIMYHPPVSNAEYIELYNRHPTFKFDLSGFRMGGVAYTLPAGAFINPNSYLILAKNRATFAATYGANIPVAGEFTGNLAKTGERLRLIKFGATESEDIVIAEVSYEHLPPWPTTTAGFGPSLQLIDPARDNWRVGNWVATPIGHPGQATPGRANAAAAAIEPFPLLWINEVLPLNQTGAMDNHNQFEPWIELYNSSGTPLDLSGYTLSDDPASLSKWSFPPGTALGPGQFLLVWADGEPGQSTTTALHTSFRLNPTNGIVLLSRTQIGAPAVIDYVRYLVTSPDRSYGSLPDGNPLQRQTLDAPTAGAANQFTLPPGPALSAGLQPDGQFRISWTTKAGVSYRLQSAASLNDPVWQTIREWMGDGSLVAYFDGAPLIEPARYYRVLIE